MSLSDYFRSQAEWRRQKAEEYPEDERNAQSAAALASLAEFVEPDEHGQHEAGAIIDRLNPHLFEGVTLGGGETQRAVSRYGFGYPVASARQHEEFLDELATLCLEDAYAFVRDQGDPYDWTGTLFDFEIQAALDDVPLPRRYFELRPRSSGAELRADVEAYRAGETPRPAAMPARGVRPSTAAYLKAIAQLRGRVGDPIDVDVIEAIDLDAICPHSRPGHPTDDDGAWSVEELQRWHVESRISLLTRRARALHRGAVSIRVVDDTRGNGEATRDGGKS